MLLKWSTMISIILKEIILTIMYSKKASPKSKYFPEPEDKGMNIVVLGYIIKMAMIKQKVRNKIILPLGIKRN